jgi:replication factor C subunit 1
MSLFTDKYRPSKSEYIVGAEWVVRELTTWLKAWHTPKGGGSGRPDTYRALLIAGPPGVGKSMVAELVCAECGISNSIRVDALCKRTQKALKAVEDSFTTRKVDAYMTGKMQRSKLGAVIIEDLDAMVAGGADRGGVNSVVRFIARSRVPVICVCNDLNNRALQTLASKCRVVRMQQVQPRLVEGHLMLVCRKEGIKASQMALRDIAVACGGDVRQAVTELQFCRTGDFKVISDATEKRLSATTVDRTRSVFDLVAAAFAGASDAVACAAVDTDPLLATSLVHENYPMTKSALGAQGEQALSRLARAADHISCGDYLEWASRHGGLRGIADDAKAEVAILMPCREMGPLAGKPSFPAILGKTSALTKNSGFVDDITLSRTRCHCHTSVGELFYMRRILVDPLIKDRGLITETVKRSKECGLGKDEWEALCGFSGVSLPPQVKTAVAKAFAGNRKRRPPKVPSSSGDEPSPKRPRRMRMGNDSDYEDQDDNTDEEEK